MRERRSPFARRRFGQHFLRDRAVIDHILHEIAPARGETIIEIGPGRGALTVPLLRHGAALHVVEIDRDLAAALAENCRSFDNLHIHCRDALRFSLGRLGGGPFKVVGNLPYNISTPLLFHLLEQARFIRTMVFMLQREVVDRLCAPTGGSDYGRLSIMVQARCAIERLFDVEPEAFEPPPKVDSALLRLTPDPGFADRVADEALFNQLVKTAFLQRRKMLRNSLHDLLGDPEPVLREVSIDASSRPQDLGVDQYLRLANHLAAAAPGGIAAPQ